MSGGDWKELFNAACDGDLALVAYHVQAGVDINYAHPEFLSTPLVASILAGQAPVALYLLEQGASPQLGSEFDQQTPMQAAQAMGMTAVVERLVQLGVPLPAATALPPLRQRRSWLARLLLKDGDG